MSEVPIAPGYMTEDLELRVIAGPPRYRARTEGPVEYLTVADQGGVVVGYIYANDGDDAAGWVSHAAAGHHAHSAYPPWMAKLRVCKARGLLPSAALTELVRDGTDSTENPRSRVQVARHCAPSVAGLREKAAAAH